MFGRFEAGAPNVLWAGDVLHGPLIGGKKTYLFAFLDDHSRFITGHRWGWSEDSLHLAAAFKRAVAARGLPRTAVRRLCRSARYADGSATALVTGVTGPLAAAYSGAAVQRFSRNSRSLSGGW